MAKVTREAVFVPTTIRWAKPETLAKLFDYQRTKIYELIDEMRESIPYREYVIKKPRDIKVRVE